MVCAVALEILMTANANEYLPVSTIIVNDNAGELLIGCVRIALAQSKQVIVVDNASSDHSINMLA